MIAKESEKVNFGKEIKTERNTEKLHHQYKCFFIRKTGIDKEIYLLILPPPDSTYEIVKLTI